MARFTNRPQPPAGSSLLPPAPKPQLPPAAPALQQRAAAAMFLALLSLFAMLLNGHVQRTPYVLGVALLVALTGLVLAISSIRAAKRAGTRRPRGSALGVTFSAICVAFSGLALAGFLIFWPQFTQFSNCMNSAGSSTAAQNACQTNFDNSVTTRITNLGGK